MKSLYIITFLALSANIYAQQEKKAEIQEAPNYKESKEFEARMMKEAQERAAQKPSATALASEQGLEMNKQQSQKQETTANSGKLLPNTASFEEFLATIPGRQARKANHSKSTNTNTQGVLSTPELTIYDIKKTIPKN
jgi:flagellar hook-associated protein FlgK